MSDLRERRIEAADALSLRAQNGHYGSMLDDLRGITYTDGTWRDVFRALARLIDPITTVTEGDEGEELYPVNMATCSACGGTFWAADIFEYCPRCGARITEWQEDECERS